MAQVSTYAATYNRLEIDGSGAGPLRSAEGGDPYGQVVSVDLGGGVTGKRISAVSFSDIVMESGLSPSRTLADWIRATLTQSYVRHGGAIVEYDRNFKESSRLKFQDATIREIEFPALDAALRDPSHLTIRVAPESTHRETGSGASQPMDSGEVRSKRPRSCDFRLQIDGLDTTRVTEVGALVVRQAGAQQAVGDLREYATAPSSLEIGDLVVTAPEAADWYAWRDAFLIAGTGTERNGSLEYLAPNRADVVARIEFSGLGIHSLVRDRSGEEAQAIRRVRASMYCRNLSFPVLGAAAPAAAVADTTSTPTTPPSRVAVNLPLADRVLTASRFR